jgi:hypothetical protein
MQCASKCADPEEKAERAPQNRLLKTSATLQYNYCNVEFGAYSEAADVCVACLEGVPSAKELNN